MAIESAVIKAWLEATGKFENLVECREGACAYSFIATHHLLNRKVFIKVFDYVHAFKEMALKEPKLLVQATNASPRSENIVTVHDADRIKIGSDEFVCLQVEFVDGKSLLACLQSGEFGQQDAIRITLGILNGLAHLHNNGLLHRDIKPSNVMHGSVPKLTDFGSAALIPDSGEIAGASRHSILYVPPECWRPEKCWNVQSDLYQVGMVLYELANGPLNFTHEHYSAFDSERLAKKHDLLHLNDPAERAIAVLGVTSQLLSFGRQQAPYLSPKIQSLVKSATNPDFTKRPPTALRFSLAANKIHVPNWRPTDSGEFEAENWRGKDWKVFVNGSSIDLLAAKKGTGVYRRISKGTPTNLEGIFRFVEDHP